MLSELIVKFFHGDFTPQGFKRYSGLWKGPPPGNIGKKARGDETENINCDDCGRWRQGESLNPVSISHMGMDQYLLYNTIFSGMNIHLPAILMFTRGTGF